MKKVHHKVNIVPLLAKADTLTDQEIAYKKARILQDIKTYNIRIYTLPDGEEEINQNSSVEERRYKNELEVLKKAMPFAVVGSTDFYEIGGRRVRGRLYPWGVVEVENLKHSEFGLLKNMLITHLQDLQEVTHDCHYETYRTQKISETSNRTRLEYSDSNYGLAPSGAASSINSENMSLLADKEAEIQRMKEMMARMQRELAITQAQQGRNY